LVTEPKKEKKNTKMKSKKSKKYEEEEEEEEFDGVVALYSNDEFYNRLRHALYREGTATIDYDSLHSYR